MTDPAGRCPLCGGDNACGRLAGAERCWCFELTIPAEVLARIPESARGAACICEACARGAGPARRPLRVLDREPG